MSKKILKHVEKSTSSNGEELTIEKTYIIKTKADSFYMSFIDNMSGFFELTSATSIKILTILCNMAEYNTGIVRLTSEDRREIIDTLGIAATHLSNHLKILRDKNLIEGKGGKFIINPIIFWKGELKERSNLIKSKKLSINIKIEEE